MNKMFLVVYIFVFSTQILCSNLALRKCLSRDDCQVGEFCYQQRYCHSCISCEEHFQQEPQGCAKLSNECGDCLPGYIEDPRNKYIDGRKRCIPDQPIETTTLLAAGKDDNAVPGYDDKIKAIWNITGIVLGVTTPVVLILGALYYFCCRTTTCRYQSPEEANRLDEKTNIDTRPSAPLAPLLNNPVYVEHSHPIDMGMQPPAYTPQVIPEPAQQARPFSAPSAYVSPPNVSEDNTDSMQLNEPNVPDDENTQPSSWTPAPARGERTSFAGILVENAARPVRRDSSSPRNTPEEPPPKQAKSDNPVVNINVVTINSSFVQQSSQTNSFPTNVTNVNSQHHREQTSPSRSRVPEENQENEEIVPNNRNNNE